MTFNMKDYVNDLIPNSAAIQIINDDFRHVFQDLRLWSFYETVKTNMGVSQALIVEKDSAVLGKDILRRNNIPMSTPMSHAASR